MLLGVNIDHVATIRQARGGMEPDVLKAAITAQKAGADGITVHLREDRRHIQDQDVINIKKKIKVPLNLEMAVHPEILKIALELKPEKVCLVPEKREERTTEGGLNIKADKEKIKAAVAQLKEKGIEVSLFIEPEPETIQDAADVGADVVEFHTGTFAHAFAGEESLWKKEIIRLHNATQEAILKNLRVNAGHGLNYENVEHLLKIPHIQELNIGHAIISRAVFTGLDKAVKEMKKAIEKHAVSAAE